MKYIFEDKEDSTLSKFFRLQYPKLSKDFIYAGGNTYIPSLLFTLLADIKQTDVCLFMDLIPDNPITSFLFRQIRMNYNDIIIVPCICAEYYMLCSLDNSLVSDIDSVSRVRSIFLDYKSCGLVHRYNSLIAQKNFEKFCKFVLKRGTSRCVSCDRRLRESDIYYISDCPCNTQCHKIKATLTQKVLAYVSSYPLYPDNSLSSLDTKNIRLLINEELDKYNSTVKDSRNLINPRFYF